MTTLPCYCTILFAFDLSYNETKSYLLLILKGFHFWLIVCTINTSFHIHFNFFISWKQNIIFIHTTCCRWSTDLFDVNLIKEYKLGLRQWRKLVFVVIVWYMPYFHLLPFVIIKQYVEGEMSRFIIFVLV